MWWSEPVAANAKTATVKTEAAEQTPPSVPAQLTKGVSRGTARKRPAVINDDDESHDDADDFEGNTARAVERKRGGPVERGSPRIAA